MSHYSTHYRSHQIQAKEQTRQKWTIAMHTWAGLRQISGIISSIVASSHTEYEMHTSQGPEVSGLSFTDATGVH